MNRKETNQRSNDEIEFSSGKIESNDFRYVIAELCFYAAKSSFAFITSSVSERHFRFNCYANVDGGKRKS